MQFLFPFFFPSPPIPPPLSKGVHRRWRGGKGGDGTLTKNVWGRGGKRRGGENRERGRLPKLGPCSDWLGEEFINFYPSQSKRDLIHSGCSGPKVIAPHYTTLQVRPNLLIPLTHLNISILFQFLGFYKVNKRTFTIQGAQSRYFHLIHTLAATAQYGIGLVLSFICVS